jgi:hypothetical protein
MSKDRHDRGHDDDHGRHKDHHKGFDIFDDFFAFDGGGKHHGHDGHHGGHHGKHHGGHHGKDLQIAVDGDHWVLTDGHHSQLISGDSVVLHGKTFLLVDHFGGGYQTIQEAVDAAQNGATVLIADGTYAEQVTVVGKDLTIKGEGDAALIVAPDTLTANIVDTSASRPGKNALIGVDGGDVTIKNLSIDGLGQGNELSNASGAPDYEGIYYLNASGEIDGVSVTGIREPLHGDGSLSGNQLGNGIVISNQDGVARTVEVSHSTVTDFQKTGMVFDGEGLTVDVDHNTVVGGGLQPLGSPAQNGIQISDGATGTIAHNSVSGLGYGPDSWSASGILVYGSDDVTVKHNDVVMVGDSMDAAIAFVDADNPTATHNDVTATFGIYQQAAYESFTNELNHSHNTFHDATVAVGFYGVGYVGYGAPNVTTSFDFTGSKGNDEIWGANGSDTLNGGRGDDGLRGDSSSFTGYGAGFFGTGTGDDTFVFDKHSGDDIIVDFGQVAGNRDVMDVSAYHFHDFDDLQDRISDNVDGNAVIQLTSHDSITLEGVQAADLTQDDFILSGYHIMI